MPLGASTNIRRHARTNWTAKWRDRASIWRIHTQTVTSDFGHSTLWEHVGADLPANFWSITGREALVLSQVDTEGTVTLLLPYNADVTEKDQVLYHINETGLTIHLDVTYVHTRSHGQDTHVTCIFHKFAEPNLIAG